MLLLLEHFCLIFFEFNKSREYILREEMLNDNIVFEIKNDYPNRAILQEEKELLIKMLIP